MGLGTMSTELRYKYQEAGTVVLAIGVNRDF